MAGAQALQIFDSWVGRLSPLDYATRSAAHARLFDAARRLGVPVIHFGTGTAGLLGQMARAGGDVIGVDWRIGLADAWNRIGSAGIQGNLDPSIALAPLEVVAGAAQAILRDAAGRPGHIFNLGHGVLPETPMDTLRRLADFVHEYADVAVAGGS